MKQILSCGAGVQSSTILMQSLLGELPPLDAVIFADTGWEPAAVYSHMRWLKEQTESKGIPFYIVKKGNLKDDVLFFQRYHKRSPVTNCYGSIPWFILSNDGEVGMTTRQCTFFYKIVPINRKIRELVGLAPGQRAKKGEILSRTWIGISWDERLRMKDPEYAWMENFYPLVDERHTRQWCLEWWAAHFPDVTLPRSACCGCPFKSNKEWQRFKQSSPEEFAETARFESECQQASKEAEKEKCLLIGVPYLHRSCQPLAEVNFDPDADQMVLFDNECTGICGV